MSKIEPKNNRETYCVGFDTKTRPGYVLAVCVTIETVVVLDDESVRIDLADHPLYKDLQHYVKGNPR